MQFKVEAFHNPYLPAESKRVDAILSASAEGEIAAIQPRVEALIVDISGSMQGERITAAKAATRKAIAMLAENTQFFVVAFATQAQLVSGLLTATPQNKAYVDALVVRLEAGGNTYMSRALELARRQFLQVPDAITHALFLTDGKNAPEDSGALVEVLRGCEGVFQCDCRGVGTDWSPSQLRQIAAELMGAAQIIAEPAGMEADFQATIASAQSRAVREVRLRIWTPKTARIVSCKQMSPEIVDLTTRATVIDGQNREYPTGAWAKNESRDYHVGLEIEPGATGDEMLACRATMVWSEEGAEHKSAPALVLATWTADEALSTRINAQVAHYTGQQELAEAIQQGLEAREAGQLDTATRLLGRAVQLAQQSGNEDATRRLTRVVDVVDAHEGTVRLRRGVDKAAEMDLDLMSTRTKRVAPAGGGE